MKASPFLLCIDALTIDSLLDYLSVYERLQVQLYRAGRSESLPTKAKKLMEYIDINNVDIPHLSYNSDRELVYLHNKKYKPICTHPLYRNTGVKNEINDYMMT